MRRTSVVASVALITTIALAGMPVPVGSWQAAERVDLAPAAFTMVTVPAAVPALEARDVADPAPDAAAADAPVPDATDTPYVEPGAPPSGPTARPAAHQPAVSRGSAWKAPKRVITGFASFYDSGTTAMRLPRGTLIRICGDGGCIQRTVTDYGPRAGTGRIIDMYRADFFKICGCASWSGTTKVRVSVY